jgi:hypothetical protein
VVATFCCGGELLLLRPCVFLAEGAEELLTAAPDQPTNQPTQPCAAAVRVMTLRTLFYIFISRRFFFVGFLAFLFFFILSLDEP